MHWSGPCCIPKGCPCLGSRRGPNPGMPGSRIIHLKEHCRYRCLLGGAPHNAYRPPVCPLKATASPWQSPGCLEPPSLFLSAAAVWGDKEDYSHGNQESHFQCRFFFTFHLFPCPLFQSERAISRHGFLMAWAEPCLCRQPQKQPAVCVGVCRLLPRWKETPGSAWGGSDPILGSMCPGKEYVWDAPGGGHPAEQGLLSTGS